MRKISITMDEAFNQKNCCNCAKVMIEEDNGIKKERTVTIDSLIMAMKESLTTACVYHSIGEIPFGYYDAEIGSERGKFCAKAVMVLPAGKQMMKYEDTYYDAAIPSLVFDFDVSDERLSSTQVYVMKNEKPTDKSQLYRYPFGNVSESGTVCWGRNQLPKIRKLKDLEEIMMLFIQSPCNSDYYRSSMYCGHEGVSLRELFEMLKDEESYPEDYLVPLKGTKGNVVLGNLMQWKKNNRRRA